MAIDNAFVDDLPPPSVICTVNEYVPAVAGVPEMVFPASARPGGKEPETMLHVNNPSPPDAARLALYDDPTEL